MIFDKVSLLFSSVCLASIGIFVFLKNGENLLNRIFSTMAFSISLWVAANFMEKISGSEYIYFWSQIAVSSSALIVANFLYFSTVFPEGKGVGNIKKFIIYLPFLLFSFSFGQVISQPGILPFGFKNEYGSAYPFFCFIFYLILH